VRTGARQALPLGAFKLMTKENITELLPPDKRSLKNCEGECEVETGRLLGANYLVTGTVTKFSGELRVTIRLYDVAGGDMLDSKKASAKKVKELEKPIEEIAETIFKPLPGSRLFSLPTSTPPELFPTSPEAAKKAFILDQDLGKSISPGENSESKEITAIEMIEIIESNLKKIISNIGIYEKRKHVEDIENAINNYLMKNANSLDKELMAKSLALLGIAKGYEGIGAAATDNFAKAREIFPNVMSMTACLGEKNNCKPIAELIANSTGYWGNSSATRVDVYGKRMKQSFANSLRAYP